MSIRAVFILDCNQKNITAVSSPSRVLTSWYVDPDMFAARGLTSPTVTVDLNGYCAAATTLTATIRTGLTNQLMGAAAAGTVIATYPAIVLGGAGVFSSSVSCPAATGPAFWTLAISASAGSPVVNNCSLVIR